MFLKVPTNSRYEIKFIAYDHQYALLQNWIKLHGLNFYREYKPRLVNNIYFDSFDLNSYKSNIHGDSSRIKLRYRWYDNFKKENLGKFEIKFKRNLYGWKKKFDVSDFAISDKITWKMIIKLINNNLPKKYQYYFKENSIPQIINQYHRDYYISNDKKIRVTVDKDHYVFDQRHYESPNLKKKTLTQRFLVMEFKFNRNSVNEISNLIKGVPIRSSRNSKYVNSIRAITGI